MPFRTQPLTVRPAPDAEGLLTHGLYQIATGKWRPGGRLPSVRRAAELWGVDPRVVLRAFQRLEELGLVEARARSGFFVTPGPELGRIARHRHELERLYERFEAEVEAETGLSAVGAFHYFAQLAGIRAQERPPCAFVECTATQAGGHADEVFARLGVPCLPVTTDEITPGLQRLPDHVQTFLISSFHVAEVRGVVEEAERGVAAVPIEVSGGLLDELPARAKEGVLFESDETEARNILEDVAHIGPPLTLGYEVVDDVDAALEDMLGAGDEGRVALLSPRLWGGADARWQEHPAVRQVAFRIRDDAWPAIADAVGLPLGSLGGSRAGRARPGIRPSA